MNPKLAASMLAHLLVLLPSAPAVSAAIVTTSITTWVYPTSSTTSAAAPTTTTSRLTSTITTTSTTTVPNPTSSNTTPYSPPLPTVTVVFGPYGGPPGPNAYLTDPYGESPPLVDSGTTWYDGCSTNMMVPTGTSYTPQTFCYRPASKTPGVLRPSTSTTSTKQTKVSPVTVNGIVYPTGFPNLVPPMTVTLGSGSESTTQLTSCTAPTTSSPGSVSTETTSSSSTTATSTGSELKSIATGASVSAATPQQGGPTGDVCHGPCAKSAAGRLLPLSSSARICILLLPLALVAIFEPQ